MDSILTLIANALTARAEFFDQRHETAFRLFNGFLEGCPDLAVDLYARTLVIHDYAAYKTDRHRSANSDNLSKVELSTNYYPEMDNNQSRIDDIQHFLITRLPWVHAVILKTRNPPLSDKVHTTRRELFSPLPREEGDRAVLNSGVRAKSGYLIYGDAPDRKVCEYGVWYALELLHHQDASLYLDTRNLRKWAIENLSGKSVLNTFAYTGSLGVAALAGDASRVVHIDLNRVYLNIAKASYTLNGFPIQKADFHTGDFFPEVSRLKREGIIFDCVFLDPPFFSITARGRVDLVSQHNRLINKVRPLIKDNGWLIAVNNALFVRGADYVRSLEALCASGYLTLEALIAVPPDIAGFPETQIGLLPADPTPFNHATKIAVLRVKRSR